jgi:predicted ATP-dependent protease
MSDWSSRLATDGDREQRPAPADISVTAHGDRRTLEALYLELRQLAKQNGLKIEYRLSLAKPADQDES